MRYDYHIPLKSSRQVTTMNEFLTNLKALWSRERLATRERFDEQRIHSTLNDRVRRGNALAGVEIEESAAAPGDRVLLWVSASAESLGTFRASSGSPVRIWVDRVDEPGGIDAVISRRKANRLGLVVDVFPPDKLFDRSFNLDAQAPETTFDRADKAIAAFVAAKERDDLGPLKAVLTGEAEPSSQKNPTLWQPIDRGLHEAQIAAVQNALDTRDVALVHGPPGTGKTRTLVEIVEQEVLRGNRVLVTAASNTAVDTIMERLEGRGLNPLRLGHPARVLESLEYLTLDARLEARPDFALIRGWQDQAARLFRKARQSDNISRLERRELFAESRRLNQDARRHMRGIQDAIVSTAHVVCATAAGADIRLLNDVDFDVVVLDEATQTPDPIALIAAQRAPRLIVAGDPRQLPPTIIDRSAGIDGLATTFFERLERHAVMLNVQHRMHRAIMGFSSELFYGGRLVAADSVAEHCLEDLGVTPDPLRPGPLVFMDTAGKGFDEVRTEEDPSTSNPGQAERTALEVRRLLSRGISPENVAVITPYDAQSRLLKTLLDIPGLEIGTIDGFQGREKEAVIIDLVRSNSTGELGFLNDTRRMNVAMTRARRFLLVVGDSATLGSKDFYQRFFEHVEEHGAYVSAWNDDADIM